LAAVPRGSAIESVHGGHIAVVDTAGRILWQTPGLDEEPVFFRSALKPIQAIPFVQSGAAARSGLGARAIALACASHAGQPGHIALIRALLRTGRLSVDQLGCGVHPPLDPRAAAALIRAGRRPTALYHDCSGKHTAMLLACRERGWPVRGYLEPRHPLQREIKGLVADFTDLEKSAIISSRDGCNLPAHAVSLRRMAMAYARLADPAFWRKRGLAERAAAVERITHAVRTHPWLVSGTGRADLRLMRAAGGRLFSKVGAEAVWCVGIPEAGLGLAMKIRDGTNRAAPAILAEALRQTCLLDATTCRRFLESAEQTIRTGDGAIVGTYRPVFKLIRAERRKWT
jgi:L-asparaginase II